MESFGSFQCCALIEKADGIRRIQTLSKVENPVRPKTYPNVR